MKLAILGAGEMGKWFAKFAKGREWEVSISDIDKEKAERVGKELNVESLSDNGEAVEGAEMVLVSVPIKETPKVIEEVSDSLEEDSLLFDIASVKEGVVDKMEEIDLRSELVSIHPLFGPGAEKIEDKNIISVPVRTGKKYQKLKKTFSDLGANVKEMEAEKHDRVMSITQSLTHFTLLSYLSALNSMKKLEEAENFQTPMFRNLLDFAKAFLRETPEVCGDIQTENRYSAKARDSIKEACRNLDEALESGDIDPIREIFEESHENIGSEEIKRAYEKIYERAEVE